ncbi:Zona pellucida domain containing protein [Trichuris trichiura]|uniref:Zona pellucida domain containing protein n=1 Tax=Trichuris trichiura TaxID=36087 RepID=A0A077ZH87_TRITR|nr:Zona pellucida domain containing protein [Trichuris trichiura]
MHFNRIVHLSIYLQMAALAVGMVIDNEIVGDPEVDCGVDMMHVKFKTKNPFEGHVYVKGHYDTPSCRSNASNNHTAGLTIAYSQCDVRRQRTTSPSGVYLSAIVVVTFHPMFVTMVDRAYNVKCFYMATDKVVSSNLEVSNSALTSAVNASQHLWQVLHSVPTFISYRFRSDHLGINQYSKVVTSFLLSTLATELITQNVQMPDCKYEVLSDGPTGQPIKYATVGQQVYHKWSCSSEAGMYCLVIF